MMPGTAADHVLLVLLSFGGAGVAIAGEETRDDAVVDMELLEYLGSWEAMDDEWMLFAGDAGVPARQTEPAPDEELPVEKDPEPTDRAETDDER
ncbi:MAG: hypothetical protein V2I25_07915 [Woeseiaceae bacterium]|jgi:hypothetical protein|nr:hypothetical protein [Woeseiaceae bacterium]